MRNGIGEVLTQLRDAGPMSRADLVRVTGLSSAGVTKVTAQIEQAGLICETTGAQEKTLGRPPVALALRPDCRSVLAVHMGAGQVNLAVSDLALNLTEPRGFDFALDMPVDQVLSRTIALAREAVQASGIPMSRFVGIGIGVPGGVDTAGRINTHSIITGWQDVAFADAFEDALGLPAIVEHNATAMAMAEVCHGATRHSDSILYLLLGKGIGGGFATGAPGHRRNPVEIGHIVVDPGGAPCRCGGHGCLELFFSQEPLQRAAGNRTGGLIAAAMASPDWPRIYEYFLQALSTTVTLLAPRSVVLAGHLTDAPEALFEALRHDLPPRVMPQQRRGLRIERTGLQGPVGVRGAACVALDKYFYEAGPTLTPLSRGLHRASNA